VKLTGMALVALLNASAAAAHPGTQRYINDNWGYSVSLPASTRYETNAPPNPNHGFRITVSKDAYVWADGSSSDDEDLKDALASESGFWIEDGCFTRSISPDHLGGRPARRTVLKCPAKGGRAAKRVVLVVALEAPADISPSAYIVGVIYREEGPDADRAMATFEAVRRGFRFKRDRSLV
jgi:hypothetical protein